MLIIARTNEFMFHNGICARIITCGCGSSPAEGGNKPNVFAITKSIYTTRSSPHFISSIFSNFDLLHFLLRTGINGSRSAILHRRGKCSSQVCLGRHHGLLGEIVFSIQNTFLKIKKNLVSIILKRNKF